MGAIMTLGEVAKFCGVHKQTLYRMEKIGKLAEIGVVPKRLQHGTKERQFTREQAEQIKRFREATDEPNNEDFK